MKRLWIMLPVLLLLLAAGCGAAETQPEDLPPTSPSALVVDGAPPEASEQSSLPAPPQDEAQDCVYRDEALGFSVHFPAEWAGSSAPQSVSEASAPEPSGTPEPSGASQSGGEPEIPCYPYKVDFSVATADHAWVEGWRCCREFMELRFNDDEARTQEANAPLRAFIEQYTQEDSSVYAAQLGDQFVLFPYISEQWLQIVLCHYMIPSYAHDGEMISLNYDLANDKIVTVAEALAQFGLDDVGLAARLETAAGQKPAEVADRPFTVQTQAFRMRDDGSCVFYLYLDFEVEENYETLYTYDTATGGFARALTQSVPALPADREGLASWETLGYKLAYNMSDVDWRNGSYGGSRRNDTSEPVQATAEHQAYYKKYLEPFDGMNPFRYADYDSEFVVGFDYNPGMAVELLFDDCWYLSEELAGADMTHAMDRRYALGDIEGNLPQELVEKTIQRFFPISSEKLRETAALGLYSLPGKGNNGSRYHADTASYYFPGGFGGGPAPYGIVTDRRGLSADTFELDCDWYSAEDSQYMFSHTTTIQVLDDAHWQYIANRVFNKNERGANE